jgi:Fe-S cluster biogenesis protein NfuA
MLFRGEPTPNPDAMRFPIPPSVREPVDIRPGDGPSGLPGAAALMSIPGIVSVYYGNGYATVTKSAEASWAQVERPASEALEGAAWPGDDEAPAEAQHSASGTDPVLEEARAVIDELVRPSIQADGGDVEILSVNDGIAVVRLRGSCVGCPSSTLTLKRGIERILMHYVDGIIEVRSEEEA